MSATNDEKTFDLKAERAMLHMRAVRLGVRSVLALVVFIWMARTIPWGKWLLLGWSVLAILNAVLLIRLHLLHNKVEDEERRFQNPSPIQKDPAK